MDVKGSMAVYSLDCLRLRFVGGLLLLLLSLFRPWRHHAVHARVADRLAEVLAKKCPVIMVKAPRSVVCRLNIS